MRQLLALPLVGVAVAGCTGLGPAADRSPTGDATTTSTRYVSRTGSVGR